MPISANTLINELGIGQNVAELFINRHVPDNNEYWLKRTGYVSLSTGYIFIPTFFDLLVKKGFDVEVILDEGLLTTMEKVLQSAGKMEYKIITTAQHIDDCRQILIENHVSPDEIERTEHMLVNRAFKHIPPRFTALRRANTFLYIFGGQPLDLDELFATWELLVPLMLMLDDFADVKEDMEAGEENCLLAGGGIANNFFELVACSSRLLQELAIVNPALGRYLKRLKEEAVAQNMMAIITLGTR